MKRIVLDYMDDPYPIPVGTQGTIEYEDDAHQIHVKWDNGSSLALIPGIDCYHEIETEEEIKVSIEHLKPYPYCPRCGGKPGLALSRRVMVDICDTCGLEEAIEDYTCNKSSIKEWYIVKELFEL